jgi:hypothetical protein
MSNTAVVVPQCTHVKTNGEVCGSPAVSGTAFCYHHSAVKAALSRRPSNGSATGEGFAPIGFLFPEDRAAMQINFFLLLEAFNEQRIDLGTYKCFLSLLRAMARNLGKTGSLTESGVAGASDQMVSNQEKGNHPGATGKSGQEAAPASHAKLNRAVNLSAASAPLRPEACFMNTVAPSAPPAYLSMKGQRGLSNDDWRLAI